jgi:hypothetical protein
MGWTTQLSSLFKDAQFYDIFFAQIHFVKFILPCVCVCVCVCVC